MTTDLTWREVPVASTVLYPVNRICAQAVRAFAAALGSAAQLGLTAAAGPAPEETDDVLFEDEARSAGLRIEWRRRTQAVREASGGWDEDEPDDDADDGGRTAETVVAHYSRTVRLLAADPRAARLFLTMNGEWQGGRTERNPGEPSSPRRGRR